jgi:hypothetical protein
VRDEYRVITAVMVWFALFLFLPRTGVGVTSAVAVLAVLPALGVYPALGRAGGGSAA